VTFEARGESAHHEAGLLDTSILIAQETGRPVSALPQRAAISVVTIAELYPAYSRMMA